MAADPNDFKVANGQVFLIGFDTMLLAKEMVAQLRVIIQHEKFLHQKSNSLPRKRNRSQPDDQSKTALVNARSKSGSRKGSQNKK